MAASASSSSPPPPFSVRQCEPELVAPAKSTPRELKQLSDIDDQQGLRFQMPVIFFYKSNPSMKGKDPVKVIREAVAKALVLYYPFAGRIREGADKKLTVDCTGEGVLFIEADADTTLEQLGDKIRPPCPYLDELLCDVPGSGGIVGCPLLLIQVTRFVCGGFVFAIRLNHTMSDAPGLAQFLTAVGEFAKGEENSPSLLPVWQRELFNARSPPRITCKHHEYEPTDDAESTADAMADAADMVDCSFFFGPKQVRALRDSLPPHHQKCSTFELLSACIWRCRVAALQLHPNEIVRISCIANARGKSGIGVPSGYYGNAFVFPAAVSTAGMLCTSPLEYAVELIKKAKAQMSEEYIKSVADLLVIKGRPSYRVAGNYVVSLTSNTGLDKVDFGWGKPVFGGPAKAISLISFFTRFKDSKGEDGTLGQICLPLTAMKRFQQEVEKMTQVKEWCDIKPTEIMSRL